MNSRFLSASFFIAVFASAAASSALAEQRLPQPAQGLTQLETSWPGRERYRISALPGAGPGETIERTGESFSFTIPKGTRISNIALGGSTGAGAVVAGTQLLRTALSVELGPIPLILTAVGGAIVGGSNSSATTVKAYYLPPSKEQIFWNAFGS